MTSVTASFTRPRAPLGVSYRRPGLANPSAATARIDLPWLSFRLSFALDFVGWMDKWGGLSSYRPSLSLSLCRPDLDVEQGIICASGSAPPRIFHIVWISNRCTHTFISLCTVHLHTRESFQSGIGISCCICM